MKKEYNPPEFIEVDAEESDSARYRLPYGIAKGLGLSTDGMTPREVWEMLKGRGINPKNEYDKLKEKATEEIKSEPIKQVDTNRVLAKETIVESNAFKTIKKGAQEKVKEGLEKLSDDNLQVVSKYIDDLNEFGDKSGAYSKAKIIYYNQDFGGGALDKELGFDFDATTFFHEFGHFVDNVESGSYWGMSTDSISIAEDKVFCFNEIAKEGGLQTPLKSLDRITREQKQCFWQGLKKITGKGTEKQYKTRRDFGYISEPYKPTYTPERAKELFGDMAYQNTLKLWENYNQDYQKYIEAQTSGLNETAIKKAEEWNSTLAEDNASYNANLERFGIITDFIGMATNNKFDCKASGYYGHSGTYNKEHKAQLETWAEFFSFKMTNDTKGLDIMRKYLPNLFKTFEDKFSKLRR